MRPCPGHLAGMMKALSSQGYVREILGARCEEYTSFQDDNLMRCPKPCILDSLLPEAPLGESCWNSPCHHLMLPGPEIVFRWSHTGTAVSLLVHIELLVLYTMYTEPWTTSRLCQFPSFGTTQPFRLRVGTHLLYWPRRISRSPTFAIRPVEMVAIIAALASGQGKGQCSEGSLRIGTTV